MAFPGERNQPLTDDEIDDAPPITVPISRSQFGAFVGTPSDVVAKAARDRENQIAAQQAYQLQIARAPVAANAPAAVVPIAAPVTAPVAAGGPPPVAPVVVPGDAGAGAPPPGTPLVAAPPAAPITVTKTGGAGAGGAPPPAGGIPASLTDADKQIEINRQAEAGAVGNQGDVEAIAAQKKADALEDQARLQRSNAVDLAAQQQYVRDRQAELNAVDTRNLQYARDKVIPDFWDGKEGQHVGATIGVVVAGLGAGLLGSNTNQATQVIQHNVDAYYDRKKEEIDNLFKYASAQGLVNDKARMQYANSITDLLQQHAATLDAAKDHVEAVATESQSDQAKARAQVLAAQLGSAAAKEHLQVNDARIKYYDAQDSNKAKLMEARAALINAGANVTRANAAGGTPSDEGVPSAGSKIDQHIMSTYVNPARKEANKDRARVQMLGQLKESLADPNLTYGQAKQILINGFTAAGGNPGGRIAVADIKEVLPGMQSSFGHFMSELDQGADNKVSPEFRKTVGNTVIPELNRWTQNYRNNGDTFEKNLSLPPAAAKHYRQQIYPDSGPAPAAAAAPATAQKPQQLKHGNTVYNLQPDGTYK